MTTTTRPRSDFARTATVAALVATPALTAVSVLLQPDLGGSSTDRLAALADGPLPAVSAVAFLLSQLPMLVAIIGVGRMLRDRAPRLSAWGTSLGVLGAFGHTVFGGMSLVYLVMARDPGARTTYAGLLDHLETTPVMLFALAGTAGTVLGLLLLSIGLFRTRTGPRWVGPVLWAFLVVEYAGTGLSPYAAYLSLLCFAAAFLAMARHVATDPGARAAAEEPAAAPALG